MKKKYNTLILSGGGINGLYTLGGMQYIDDQNYLENVNKYVGTSIGTFICYLIIIGYKPLEIISKVISEKLLEKFEKINLINTINGHGIYPWKHIDDFLINLTLEKCEQTLTFKDIFDKYDCKFICCTYNITKQVTEYISVDTHPNLLCTSAIRMSCNVPLLFSRYRYKDSYYIDGGIVNDFPITIVSEDENILGIYLAQGDRLNNDLGKYIKIPETKTNHEDQDEGQNEGQDLQDDVQDDVQDEDQDLQDDVQDDVQNLQDEDQDLQDDDQDDGKSIEDTPYINVDEGEEDIEKYDIQNYLFNIFYTPITHHIWKNIDTFLENQINSEKNDNTDIIIVPVYSNSFNFTNLRPGDLLETFSNGYQSVKKYYIK